MVRHDRISEWVRSNRNTVKLSTHRKGPKSGELTPRGSIIKRIRDGEELEDIRSESVEVLKICDELEKLYKEKR